jgi:hypothetical protein
LAAIRAPITSRCFASGAHAKGDGAHDRMIAENLRRYCQRNGDNPEQAGQQLF